MLLELSVTKTMQKESTHLDLWFRNGGWSKFSQISELNLNKQKILGGDVEDVKRECASTGTPSGASGEADTGPDQSGEREGDRDQRGGGASPELTPATRGFGARLEG